MGFQLVFTIFIIFMLIWSILRFIVPMFFSDEKKQRLADEEAERVKAKKMVLAKEREKLSTLKEDLVVTKDLKEVVKQTKEVNSELETTEEELKNLKGN